VNVEALSLKDLLNSDEAFFTGTAAEVTPIREVDGTVIGEGARGPVTRAIQSAFFSATAGRNERYRHWLTFVAQSVGLIH
jgi:branched-chain amino acid aminotransferase